MSARPPSPPRPVPIPLVLSEALAGVATGRLDVGGSRFRAALAQPNAALRPLPRCNTLGKSVTSAG